MRKLKMAKKTVMFNNVESLFFGNFSKNQIDQKIQTKHPKNRKNATLPTPKILQKIL
jgi:hypothetical protein